MILCTGDIHGDIKEFISRVETFVEYRELEDVNYVIIAGDFGGTWYDISHPLYEKYYNVMSYFNQEEDLDRLNEKPWVTLFVDGNHENFDKLYLYPVKEWNGGKVHEIRPNVLHLMRGEVFTIEGKKILAMGGAACHDIQDGVLDPWNEEKKIMEWEKDRFKLFRIKEISWWEEELPSEDEKMHCAVNIALNDYKFDYIISHELPASDVGLMGRGYIPDDYSKWLERVRANVQYKKWIGGHYHTNQNITDKETVLYFGFEELR